MLQSAVAAAGAIRSPQLAHSLQGAQTGGKIFHFVYPLSKSVRYVRAKSFYSMKNVEREHKITRHTIGSEQHYRPTWTVADCKSRWRKMYFMRRCSWGFFWTTRYSRIEHTCWKLCFRVLSLQARNVERQEVWQRLSN